MVQAGSCLDPYPIKMEDVGWKFAASIWEVHVCVKGCLRGLHMYLPGFWGEECLAQGLLDALVGWGTGQGGEIHPVIIPPEAEMVQEEEEDQGLAELKQDKQVGIEAGLLQVAEQPPYPDADILELMPAMAEDWDTLVPTPEHVPSPPRIVHFRIGLAPEPANERWELGVGPKSSPEKVP